MNVLVLWPPAVPSYFNAGHRIPVWEVASYLRQQDGRRHVTAIDAGALNYTHAAVARELIQCPDVLAVQNEFDTIWGMKVLIAYCRSISPNTRIVTFGRLSSRIPGFFTRYGLDGVVASGDWEAGVAQFVDFVDGTRNASDVRGLLLRNEDGTYTDTGKGTFLPAEQWAFPDVSEIPWPQYARLSGDASLEFSGLPGLRELPVSIARGCPLGCRFCLVPTYQGRKERRRSVRSIIEYIDAAHRVYPFDYITAYCPTFTLQREWVLEFCDALRGHRTGYSWKTCTTLHHLDRELLGTMAATGCRRIGVGVETLEPAALEPLPPKKRVSDEHLRDVARRCRELDIELTCFVMLGMPGQTTAGLAYTLTTLRDLGVRLRPTLYAPYHDLTDDMDEEKLTLWNRQILDGEQDGQLCNDNLYRIQFGDRDKAVAELVNGASASSVGDR